MEPRLPPSGVGPVQHPTLALNPTILNFGSVVTGTSAVQTVQMANPGNIAVILIEGDIQDVVGDSTFSFSPNPLPSTLAAGDVIDITVTMLAGTVGTSATGTLAVAGHADNSPVRVSLLGQPVSTSVQALSINPSSFFFPGTTEIGTDSASQTFVITNTGLLNVGITSIQVIAPFVASGLPTFPVTLTAGQTLSFTVVFRPTTMGLAVNTLGVAWNQGSSYVTLQGTGTPFTPAYVVTGITDVGNAAFRNQGKQFDNQDFNCEGICEAVRWHDFGKPGVVKNYFATCLVYEDLGDAQVNVYTRAHGILNSITIGLGDTNSKDILDATATLTSPAGYAIQTQIERLPDHGPVSITGIIHKYVVEEVYRGTLQIPANFTPAFTVAGLGETGVFGFSANVQAADNQDFNCEFDAVALREFAFNELGFEKSLLRAELVAENYGETLVTLQADNRRNQSVEGSVRVGGNPANYTTQSSLIDLDIQDEVITLTLIRRGNGGPLWLSAFVLRHVGRGEVKGT